MSKAHCSVEKINLLVGVKEIRGPRGEVSEEPFLLHVLQNRIMPGAHVEQGRRGSGRDLVSREFSAVPVSGVLDEDGQKAKLDHRDGVGLPVEYRNLDESLESRSVGLPSVVACKDVEGTETSWELHETDGLVWGLGEDSEEPGSLSEGWLVLLMLLVSTRIGSGAQRARRGGYIIDMVGFDTVGSKEGERAHT